MFGSRWITTPSWLSRSVRPFLYSSSVFSCHFLISSASVRSLPFLSFIIVVQLVKNLPAMQETQVRSLGQEDPLEKGMTTHPLQYSCLENPKDRGPHSPLGSQRVRQDWATLAGETPKKFSPRPEPIPGSSVHHGGILKLLSFPGSYEEKRGGSPLLLCPQTHLFFIILHLDSAWRSKE